MALLYLILSFVRCEPLAVRYSSVVQLKSVYTKNRLGVTTDFSTPNAESATVFSSRPPFDDGWLWTVESANESAALTRDAVRCGDALVLSNPITGLFVATRAAAGAVAVVPSPYARGGADAWRVVCRQQPYWERDAQVQLRNAKHGCYLGTGLRARDRETVNRFNVTCDRLSAGAVWAAVEGIYFAEEGEVEPPEL
jgi:hypothetical protein